MSAIRAFDSLQDCAALVQIDRNSGLDEDEQMTLREAAREARNVLYLPEDEHVPGGFPLNEYDAETNPTTRAYRSVLVATDDEIEALPDEFVVNLSRGQRYVAVTTHTLTGVRGYRLVEFVASRDQVVEPLVRGRAQTPDQVRVFRRDEVFGSVPLLVVPRTICALSDVR